MLTGAVYRVPYSNMFAVTMLLLRHSRKSTRKLLVNQIEDGRSLFRMNPVATCVVIYKDGYRIRLEVRQSNEPILINGVVPSLLLLVRGLQGEIKEAVTHTTQFGQILVGNPCLKVNRNMSLKWTGKVSPNHFFWSGCCHNMCLAGDKEQQKVSMFHRFHTLPNKLLDSFWLEIDLHYREIVVQVFRAVHFCDVAINLVHMEICSFDRVGEIVAE